MRTSRTWASSLLAMVLLVTLGVAGQEDDYERVEVVVTAVTGHMAFLSKGRVAGIDVGDEVELINPERQRAIAGRVRAVTENTCRIQLETSASGLSVGDLGEVLIPRKRTSAGEQAPPEHPPWEHEPVDWDTNIPLLAESPRTPGDSDIEASGRVFTRYFYTDENRYGNRTYQSSMTGMDMRFVNPLQKGGALDVQMDFSARRADYASSASVEDTFLRVERLSYAWGGFRGHPARYQVGRFLQNEFPEFGVLDGIEIGKGLDSGSRVGASVGFMPVHNDELRTGDDFQTALFYRYVSGEKEMLTLGTGYQKTWHHGSEDRDLVVATAEFHPHPRIFLYGGAWVDYYGSQDVIKSEGFEVTRLQANGSYRTEGGHGFGLFATHNRWPELLRYEYNPITAVQLLDNEVTRVGLNGWYMLLTKLRVYGRVDQWRDRDDKGGNGEISFSLRDTLWDRGEVSFGVTRTDGSFADSTGFRVGANKRFGRGYLDLRWIASDIEQHDLMRQYDDVTHQMVRLSYDTRIGNDWDFSIFGEDRYDDQDSFSLGFFLQRRF